MRRLIGLACAALVLLPACSAAPTPIEPTAKSPTSAGPVSARPTTTLEPPTLPKEAKRNDETGAANFVAYWVRAFNFAARTGDSADMRRFAASCKVCLGYADDFDALKPSERATTEAWLLSDVKVTRTDRGFNVEATVEAADESKTYPLTFVVLTAQPFQLQHIYERP